MLESAADFRPLVVNFGLTDQLVEIAAPGQTALGPPTAAFFEQF
jgi:hypothetical protein